jgi:hypothetical protein
MKDPSQPGLPPGGGTKLFVAALLLLGGIAVTIYSFASRGDAVDHNARTAVTIFGIAFGLIFAVAAYGLFRAVFPPKARHLTLAVERTEVRRGEQVAVRLEVGQRASDKLEVGVVCTEYYDEKRSDGRGGTNRATAEAVAHADWRPQAPGGPPQTVSFEIPLDSPYSYRGDCISYVWRVSAREPRRLRFDPATNVHLVVRP